VVIESSGAVARITLVAPDRPGLLSRATGVLALHSLQVHAAALGSHAGAAVDVFSVSPKFGSLPDPALLREHFGRAITGTLELAEKLAAKERDYGGLPQDPPEPKVLWFDNEAGGENSGAVVLEVRAPDRIGLLHSIADALERCGADVLWARVNQLGGTAVASFSLAVVGVGSPDVTWRRAIERAVLLACSPIVGR
jgi:[protein-PII] uridylyltransferase